LNGAGGLCRDSRAGSRSSASSAVQGVRRKLA
jgi:hypothetical protein